MEHHKDPISVRIARINSEILGTATKVNEPNLLSREALLDVLQALYEECCLESLQKYDTNIEQFVEKYKETIKHVKRLRVNITDFEIKNVIGRGHFGEVHLVKEKQTGDVYAMKTMKKFGSDISRTNFKEERNIMAFTNSSWLTSLQYAFQDSTYLVYIMDYHPGGDLLGLLYRQGGTLPESAATFYLAEVILALEDLHLMGYVHRDIKPDNILLDRCGHIKLADFGSAAKLNKNGLVTTGPPVGTPDYVAPEVLQCLDEKTDQNGYGVSCDFWSLGILAYELPIGKTPFTGQNMTSIFSKIINHNNSLIFPSDFVVSQAYTSLVKKLLIDQNSRLNLSQIKGHDLFKDISFDTLRDQVPPFVPKITSIEDTSNFTDVQSKKKNPNMDSFKKRTQFSGRNLPFVGFTFTHDSDCCERTFERKILTKDGIVDGLKNKIDTLTKKLVTWESFESEKQTLEFKQEELQRKLESIQNLRDRLERELAGSLAECTALKRTLELERKDRVELERKALDLIKSAKTKWETSEKLKVESLTLEIEQQKEKISELTTTNKMLNEQLQHALKLENRHKESLEKVELLSRRSVIGLESRLDKVTSETHGTISELQKKINEQVHKNNILENKLLDMKDKDKILREKLKCSEKEYATWKELIDEAESQIRNLNEKINVLELDVEKIEDYKEEITCLKKKIDCGHKAFKEIENRNTLLEIETKTLETYKKEMDEMKKTIAAMQNDKKVNELESELVKEKEKNVSLLKQLQESENIVTENQEFKELRTKFWRVERELGNAKIDKRILERELKDSQGEIKQLTEKIHDFEEVGKKAKSVHESALLELNNINETLTLELIKFKDECRIMEETLKKEKMKFEGEKSTILELKDIIRSKDDQINSLNSDFNLMKKERNNLENQIKTLENGKCELMHLLESLQKEKGDILNESNKIRRELQNTNLNLTALREACTLLENQVIEYEKLVASFESKEKDLNLNTEKLIKDLCDVKRELQETKKLVNEEKSLKLFAETKIKKLNEDIDCLQNECISYKQQSSEYRQFSSGLSNELSATEEKVSGLELTVKAYERLIEEMRSEVRHLKQETSDYLTQLNKSKELTYKLKHQLSEQKEENESVKQHLHETQRILTEKSSYYKEREMKYDATIKQQIKLIDYLQLKIDEQNHKKKTLTEVIFGSSKKENHPPLSLSMNYKDLEYQLLKERQNNQQLNEEIYKLKAATMIQETNKVADRIKAERSKSEVLSPKSKAAMQLLVNSPSKQKEFNRQNSQRRMHHNIPHRFESKFSRSSTKCSGCSEPISLGRTVAVCSECTLHVHMECKSDVQNTCGLPAVYARHYKESLPTNEEKVELNNSKDDVNVEGWIKVPGKLNTWEKRYAVLTDKAIKIFSTSPKEKSAVLLESFELKPSNTHGKVISEPLSTEIGIPVANSDILFVLKVEVTPDTTCWPPKSLVFLTLSAQDKDKWFLALQKIYYDDLDKPKCDRLLIMPEDVEVSCIVELTENIKVLGTSSGLYSYYDNTLLYIAGLKSVHQICIMSTTNKVLMTVNENRSVIRCDLNHMINLTQCYSQSTKPKLKFVEVDVLNLSGFHILQVSHFSKHLKICVANERHLLILGMDSDTSEFVPIKRLDTAEPTGCALFTETSLIVGADKFFEIDLETFQAEEFLDASDAKLKQAQSCYKMGSFPLAIIQVCKNPKEYLLSFNEFSVFVDEYGRSTRQNELKSDHLPLAFHFSKSYLYVCQFSAVGILKISEETCNNDEKPDIVRVELDKFKYLGSNKQGIFIGVNNEVRFLNGSKFIPLDDSSLEIDNSDNSEDRFTFSSSIVQSLDGNLSDNESVEDKLKRVRFSETDL
ncbi:citron Rho-interacting kinase [Diabrotica virgifera virgifera]|uniref:non-specific serine/threonine protein kinase n=1 Tax=Diabrotica virgifera virgifera TaxID=50390 RepID=A0ABM5K2M4_DIAVI|nr:citron Rho-interacting kinase [Diabrotica virgifera virgifera]